MKLLVISDAHLIIKNNEKVAYAPYVKEMDLWMDHVTQTHFICPNKFSGNLLFQAFKKQDFTQTGLRRLEFNTVWKAIISVLTLPYQAIILWYYMWRADHIHLRAPGNLTLLACLVQITLPRKRKTAKYAGNWDPKSKQPLAYRLQRSILSNTSITKNIKVMAYGLWENQSKNIAPFFTASYFEKQRKVYLKSYENDLNFMFVGTLGVNKHPEKALQLVQQLREYGVDVSLNLYGDGPLKQELQNKYTWAIFHGNQPADMVIEAYQKSHFLILASQSEGWPKVVAEAMWHGCIPIATAVSCVPFMMGIQTEPVGERGVLYTSLDETALLLLGVLNNKNLLQNMSTNAQKWSQEYTMEKFEAEIVNLLQE